MATRLVATLACITSMLAVGMCLPDVAGPAIAEETTSGYEADATEATRLYKQGRYEEAAAIFVKLSVDYPDMLVFERNLGACYYYLRKPEPAISNLRSYLGKKKEIEPEDKARIDGWIAEMEEVQKEMEEVQKQHAAAEAARAAQAAVQVSGPLDVGTVATAMPVADTTPVATRPLYTRWWFWTAVGALTAGSVTAFLLASQPAARSRCPGGGIPCDSIQ